MFFYRKHCAPLYKLAEGWLTLPVCDKLQFAETDLWRRNKAGQGVLWNLVTGAGDLALPVLFSAALWMPRSPPAKCCRCIPHHPAMGWLLWEHTVLGLPSFAVCCQGCADSEHVPVLGPAPESTRAAVAQKEIPSLMLCVPSLVWAAEWSIREPLTWPRALPYVCY